MNYPRITVADIDAQVKPAATTPKRTPTPIANRLVDKQVPEPVTGCILWTGSHSSQNGYSTVGQPNSNVPLYVHRWVWEQANGPIPTTPCPDGSHRWEIHHVCGREDCIREEHLQLVTHRQHMTIHGIERAKIRLDRLVGFTPWIATLLSAGRDVASAARITGVAQSSIRLVKRNMTQTPYGMRIAA